MLYKWDIDAPPLQLGPQQQHVAHLAIQSFRQPDSDVLEWQQTTARESRERAGTGTGAGTRPGLRPGPAEIAASTNARKAAVMEKAGLNVGCLTH